MDGVGICLNCDMYVNEYGVDLEIQDKDMSFRYSDRKFESRTGTVYPKEIVARCRTCGCEIYIPLVNDMNVAFRKSAMGEFMQRMEKTEGPIRILGVVGDDEKGE